MRFRWILILMTNITECAKKCRIGSRPAASAYCFWSVRPLFYSLITKPKCSNMSDLKLTQASAIWKHSGTLSLRYCAISNTVSSLSDSAFSHINIPPLPLNYKRLASFTLVIFALLSHQGVFLSVLAVINQQLPRGFCTNVFFFPRQFHLPHSYFKTSCPFLLLHFLPHIFFISTPNLSSLYWLLKFDDISVAFSCSEVFFFIPPLTFNCFLISFQQKKVPAPPFYTVREFNSHIKEYSFLFFDNGRESLLIVLWFVWVKCRSLPDLFLMPVCAHQPRAQFEESKWTQKERVSSFCDCIDTVLAVLQLGGAWLLRPGERCTQSRCRVTRDDIFKKPKYNLFRDLHLFLAVSTGSQCCSAVLHQQGEAASIQMCVCVCVTYWVECELQLCSIFFFLFFSFPSLCRLHFNFSVCVLFFFF